MAAAADVRDVVASLLHLTRDAIGPDTSLQRLNSSLERTKLELGLKRIGVRLPSGPVGMRFADLESRLGMGSGPAGAVATGSDPAGTARLQDSTADFGVGVDIESVATLPDTADPWEDAFYTEAFTRTEIAACQMRPEPRSSFAGLWCAKEALRKSSARYAQLGRQSVEVRHSADGAPYLQVLEGDRWQRLPCAVSISHTPQYATAVVVWRQPKENGLRQAPAPPAAPAPVRSSVVGILALLAALGALALSAYAVINL